MVDALILACVTVALSPFYTLAVLAAADAYKHGVTKNLDSATQTKINETIPKD